MVNFIVNSSELVGPRRRKNSGRFRSSGSTRSIGGPSRTRTLDPLIKSRGAVDEYTSHEQAEELPPLLIQPNRMPCSSLMPAGACMGTRTAPADPLW